jgi:hypothetical protein
MCAGGCGFVCKYGWCFVWKRWYWVDMVRLMAMGRTVGCTFQVVAKKAEPRVVIVERPT